MNRALVKYIFFLGLIMTPIFGVQEYLSMFASMGMTMGVGNFGFIKAIKDILLILMLGIFFIDVLRGRKFLNNLYAWFAFYFIVASFVATYLLIGPTMAIIGFRVFSPIFLVFIAFKYLSIDDLKAIIRILVCVAYLQFILALFQMFFAIPLYGRSYFGLAARPFGTFIYPASFAIFLCFVCCLKLGVNLVQYKQVCKSSWLFVSMSAIFIVLSGSGNGLISLAVLLVVYFVVFSRLNVYIKAGLLPIFIFAPILILLSLPILTGREDIYVSLQGRIDIFTRYIASLGLSGLLLGQGLGVGSNTAFSILKTNMIDAAGIDKLFISDSFYTSTLSQVGAVFVFAYIGFNLYLLIKAYGDKYKYINPIIVLIVPLTLIVSFGCPINELFPINWIVFAFYGLALGARKLDERKLRDEDDKSTVRIEKGNASMLGV